MAGWTHEDADVAHPSALPLPLAARLHRLARPYARPEDGLRAARRPERLHGRGRAGHVAVVRDLLASGGLAGVVFRLRTHGRPPLCGWRDSRWLWPILAFFAVRVRVVQIADSPLAPLFKVLERPSTLNVLYADFDYDLFDFGLGILRSASEGGG